MISATTFQLLGGFFACQPLGTPLLKGLAQPLAVYRVLYESMARSRLEAASSTGWTPLVGREQKSHIPPNLVVECVWLIRPPEVRICRLSIQSGVDARPPSTSTPHCPACWARR